MVSKKRYNKGKDINIQAMHGAIAALKLNIYDPVDRKTDECAVGQHEMRRYKRTPEIVEYNRKQKRKT